MARTITERANGRLRVSVQTEGPSKTEGHHSEECNINSIISRYHRTGVLDESNRLPNYGDFTNVGDYHTALSAVQEAQQNFMTLPSGMRQHFNNDPGQLLNFLENPENREEAERLGLIAKRVVEDLEPAGPPNGDPTPPGEPPAASETPSEPPNPA